MNRPVAMTSSAAANSVASRTQYYRVTLVQSSTSCTYAWSLVLQWAGHGRGCTCPYYGLPLGVNYGLRIRRRVRTQECFYLGLCSEYCSIERPEYFTLVLCILLTSATCECYGWFASGYRGGMILDGWCLMILIIIHNP